MRPDDVVEQPPRIEAPTFTPPAVPPAAAPKRSRKPRAPVQGVDFDHGGPVGHTGAIGPTGYSEANELAMTYGVGAATPPDLSKVSTEELREVLKSRGWTVQLTDG
jgi:hypothetical protein